MDAVFLLIGILSATIGALSFAATGDPWALLLTPEIPRMSDNPPAVPIEQQIASVAREIALRRRLYPKWVENGRMKPATAAAEIAAMESVFATLRSTTAPTPLAGTVRLKLREPSFAVVDLDPRLIKTVSISAGLLDTSATLKLHQHDIIVDLGYAPTRVALGALERTWAEKRNP